MRKKGNKLNHSRNEIDERGVQRGDEGESRRELWKNLIT